MDMIESASGEKSDESLVLAARSGQKEAFDELANRYLGTVYAIALGRLNNREQAEELAQEVFLRVCLLLDRLHDPALFSHWISRITRNMAIDWQRRGNRASRLLPMVSLDNVSENVEDPKASTARDEAADDEYASALHQVLARLRPEERELVLLHYMEGLSQGDIAQRLGVNKSTVSRHLERSVRRMRGLFDQALRQMATRLRPRPALHARVLMITAAAVALPPAAKSTMAATAAAALQSGTTGTMTKLGGASAGSGIMSIVHALLLLFKTGGGAVGIAKGVGVVAVAGLIASGVYYWTADDGASERAALASAKTAVSDTLEMKMVGLPGKRVVMRADVSMQQKMETEMPAGVPAQASKKAANSASSDSHMVDEFAVTWRREPGGTAVAYEIVNSEGEMQIGKDKISWSPSKPLPPVTQRSLVENQLAPMAEGMMARIGKKLTVHLSTSGTVERYEGAEEMAALTAKAVPAAMRGMMDGVTDSKTVAEQLVKQFRPSILPDGPVKIGETWKRTDTQKLGAMGDLTINQECRFAGWEMAGKRRVAVIETVGTMGGALSFSKLGAKAQAHVSNSSIKGRTLVDPETGIVIDSDIDQSSTIEVTMSMPFGAKELKMKMTGRNRTKVSLVSESDAPVDERVTAAAAR